MVSGAAALCGHRRPSRRQPQRLVTELPDGTLPGPRQDGNFIVGPTHAPAPETMPREDVPKGAIHEFTLTSAESTVFPDGIARDPGSFGTPDPTNPAKLVVSTSRPAPWTRQVSVFVPAQYVRSPRSSSAPMAPIRCCSRPSRT